MLKCVFGIVHKTRNTARTIWRFVSSVAEGHAGFNLEHQNCGLKTACFNNINMLFFLQSRGSAVPPTTPVSQTCPQSLACTTRHPTAFWRCSPQLFVAEWSAAQEVSAIHLAHPLVPGFWHKRHKSNIFPAPAVQSWSCLPSFCTLDQHFPSQPKNRSSSTSTVMTREGHKKV